MAKELTNREIQTILDRIEALDKPCVYLCPPHLDPCTKYRGHKGDCECSDTLCWMLRFIEKLRWRIKGEAE